MINKIHVTAIFDADITTVFSHINDHENFLSGGGLTCHLIKEGLVDKNGDGAIRQVVSKNLTFEEKIFEYKKNEHFAYVIISTIPKKPLVHHKGWLDFKKVGNQTQVDWHSHFEITVPVIGGLIGLFAKQAMSRIFQKRLQYLKSNFK